LFLLAGVEVLEASLLGPLQVSTWINDGRHPMCTALGRVDTCGEG
jgi:hypothetical protein